MIGVLKILAPRGERQTPHQLTNVLVDDVFVELLTTRSQSNFTTVVSDFSQLLQSQLALLVSSTIA